MNINVSTAKELVNNYKQNHWQTINQNCTSLQASANYPNVQDSRSVWVCLKDLQNFLQAISQYNADGIRIYFGEYSQDIIDAEIAAHPGILKQMPGFAGCAGMQTLLMIPTVQDGIYHRDFNFSDANNQPGQPVLPANFTNDNDLVADNHGSMMPPPYYVSGVAQNAGQDFMLYCDANP